LDSVAHAPQMTSRQQIVDGFAAHLLWAAARAKRFDCVRHQRRAPVSAIGRSPGRVPVASVQLLTRRAGVSFSFDMIAGLLPYQGIGSRQRRRRQRTIDLKHWAMPFLG
jgi:hypothetical protein